MDQDNEQNEDDQVFFDDDAFVNNEDTVEVKVDDDDVPMEEEDDDDNNENQEGNANEASEETKMAEESSVDMSIHTISSHQPSSVYTVASGVVKGTSSLGLISGGGDDKAYFHILAPSTSSTTDKYTVQTIPLQHAHTDSVSSVATNSQYVSQDSQKTPLYLAVGSYDGTIAIYDPTKSGDLIGQSIQVLDGPTDVEFVSFHPKGGSVSKIINVQNLYLFFFMFHIS